LHSRVPWGREAGSRRYFALCSISIDRNLMHGQLACDWHWAQQRCERLLTYPPTCNLSRYRARPLHSPADAPPLNPHGLSDVHFKPATKIGRETTPHAIPPTPKPRVGRQKHPLHPGNVPHTARARTRGLPRTHPSTTRPLTGAPTCSTPRAKADDTIASSTSGTSSRSSTPGTCQRFRGRLVEHRHVQHTAVPCVVLDVSCVLCLVSCVLCLVSCVFVVCVLCAFFVCCVYCIVYIFLFGGDLHPQERTESLCRGPSSGALQGKGRVQHPPRQVSACTGTCNERT
jgi:hypothetical protein